MMSQQVKIGKKIHQKLMKPIEKEGLLTRRRTQRDKGLLKISWAEAADPSCSGQRKMTGSARCAKSN